MPKETFLNLPEEKKQKVLAVLRREFQSKPFHQVNIKAIVEESQIARGSFYQYFENLEDSYFTILDLETTDIHQLFMKIFHKEGDLHRTLTLYGEQVAEILFQPDNYMIYKNRYLYWTEDLNRNWNQRHNAHAATFKEHHQKKGLDIERIHFVKSVIHSLIERNFREEWNKSQFLEKYTQHISWIEKGVHYGAF